MEKPIVLTFSLRMNATESLETIKERVEAVLGCQLQGGSLLGSPAFVGKVLGISIALLLWRGIGGTYVYQLHGLPDRRALRDVDSLDVEWDEIRIDQAIIDLLRRQGAGEWREPSFEECQAEGNYDLEDI